MASFSLGCAAAVAERCPGAARGAAACSRRRSPVRRLRLHASQCDGAVLRAATVDGRVSCTDCGHCEFSARCGMKTRDAATALAPVAAARLTAVCRHLVPCALAQVVSVVGVRAEDDSDQAIDVGEYCRIWNRATAACGKRFI